MLRTAARSPFALLAVVTLLLLSCAGPANRGLPSAAGQYGVQPHSINFDGKQYSFFWTAPDGSLREARAQDVKLVQDERTFLEIGQDAPVLHLAADEPIAVRHSGGGYASSWFPFIVPIPMGGGPVVYGPSPSSTSPAYRYPPTDKFGQGDTLRGSETTSRPAPPDYSKVQPAPGAVSGQNSGTGDGTAATNRGTGALSGQSGGTGSGSAATDRAGSATSGQAGGVGTGSAATDKAAGQSGTGQTGAGSAATDRQRPVGDSAAPAPAGGGSKPSAGSSSGSSSRPSGGGVGGGRRR